MNTNISQKVLGIVVLIALVLGAGVLFKNFSNLKAEQTPKQVAITVSAASSLTDALQDIEKLYTDEHSNLKIVFNFGSSGSLQQQIEQGAAVDVFISAAPKQMDALQSKGLLLENSRKDLLKNQLVLIAPLGSVKISDINSLSNNNVKLIANGDPEFVPSGKYAQEALSKLGLWDKTQPKLIIAKDVRQVLSYIESGAAEAGFVYLTDAKLSNKIKVVSIVDEESHSPIIYPLAIIKGTQNAAAALDFTNYLSEEKAEAVFQKYGFALVQP